MELIPVCDLPRPQALEALQQYREKFYDETVPQSILEEVYQKVGGRLTFLKRVAKSPDMIATCDNICRAEKTWFLNKCWILGEEMDDDVMDEQKHAVSNSVDMGFLFAFFSSRQLTLSPSPRRWSLPKHW